MPTQECECKALLPFPVLRVVRAFGPRMRNGLLKALEAKQAVTGNLTSQDIADCIGTVWAVLEADVESRVEFPEADVAIVNLARKQATEGQGSTIDEILDALP